MPSAVTAAGSQSAILRRAGLDSIIKLDPRKLAGNPVILATEVVAALATVSVIDAIVHHTPPGFAIQIALWLWATVLFANFAESVAEGRGKAAADALRAARVTTMAKLIVDMAAGTVVPARLIPTRSRAGPASRPPAASNLGTSGRHQGHSPDARRRSSQKAPWSRASTAST